MLLRLSDETAGAKIEQPFSGDVVGLRVYGSAHTLVVASELGVAGPAFVHVAHHALDLLDVEDQRLNLILLVVQIILLVVAVYALSYRRHLR